ncbi:MAG: acylphosphatase [Candidatus Aenigmatarchaeota archaeon]
MPVRAHVYVSGRVQGVTFRASTRRKARELNIDGWVRNLDDGRVEAVFEGDEDSVKEIVEWCKEGPSAARVDDVEIEWEDFVGEQGFDIRY